jgi:nucleotide-binding universal stress UspA family protein
MIPATQDFEQMVLKIDKQLAQDKSSMIVTYAQKLNAARIHVQGIIECGDLKPCLDEQITKTRPDLIVMGKRGLGAVKSLMLGSTSNYLVRHASVPVLVIP